jgi:hypothetical protein
LRLNYGFAPNWEATIEGDLAHALSAAIPANRLVGTTASVKTVLREGTLQEKPGPSITTEFDALLPGIGAERGVGVSLTGIVSQQWRWATLHANAAAALTHDGHADYFLDAIFEGPHKWAVRPVSEFFYELNVGQAEIGSGLIGAIWQVKDNLAVDFAVVGARVNDHTTREIRAGGTFVFGPAKGPDLLSRLAAAVRSGGV